MKLQLVLKRQTFNLTDISYNLMFSNFNLTGKPIIKTCLGSYYQIYSKDRNKRTSVPLGESYYEKNNIKLKV